jgi:EAL domain-containing protein (putative c-di-GMP-specific phosphodiesterase class I)
MIMLDGFYMHYQPIFYLQDPAQAIGYEALLRHPAGWSPSDLLREARRAGAIPVWELRVLERAVEEVLAASSSTLFFNLTPEAFADTAFPLRAARLVESRGATTARVCVEISEQGVYTLKEFVRSLQEWVDRGFFIALDDFGMQRANLDLVLSAHLDYVKIDRALVEGVACDRQKQKLLAGLVEGIAGSGAYPILEGVEKEEDIAWLAETGWDVGIQGFVMARPSTFSNFVS